MRMLLTLSACLILAMSACAPTPANETEAVDPDAATQTTVAATKSFEAALVTAIAQTAIAQTALAQATATQEPSREEAPVITAALNRNANCRSGPAGNFENILLLQVGDSGNIIGKNTEFDSLWYQLELPDGKQCWVSANALDVSGETSGLQEIQSPPTPTPKPSPTWSGTWRIWFAYNYGTSDIQESTCEFTQVGDQVTFSFVLKTTTFKFTGISSANGMTLTGTFTSNGNGPHTFTLRRDPANMTQFGGQFHFLGGTTDGDFCGARPGEAKPDPCRR